MPYKKSKRKFKRQEYDRERKKLYIELGLCSSCGKRDPLPGLRTCAYCKKSKHKARIPGCCYDCRKKLGEGEPYGRCTKCRKKRQKQGRINRSFWRATGKCIHCGRPSYGMSACPECAMKDSKRRKAKRRAAKGLTVDGRVG